MKFLSRKIALLGLCSTLLLCGCGKKIGKSDFDKVQQGMTAAEVEKILGSPTMTSTSTVTGEKAIRQTVRVDGEGADAFSVVIDGNDRVIWKTTGAFQVSKDSADFYRPAAEQIGRAS